MDKAMRFVIGGLVVLGVGAEMKVAAEPAPPGAAAHAHPRMRGPGGHDDDVRCPKTTPAALNPPADATLKMALAATGVQIYVCTAPAAGGAPVWTQKAPHAVLTHGRRAETAAIHFAGPSWQGLDGSLVTATRSASAPGADATAIPWFLLKAATHGGTGLFGDVTWIQRLDTVGGVAPATGCDPGHLDAQVLVPYRANYFFYSIAATGEQVRQCAATATGTGGAPAATPTP